MEALYPFDSNGDRTNGDVRKEQEEIEVTITIMNIVSGRRFERGGEEEAKCSFAKFEEIFWNGKSW